MCKFSENLELLRCVGGLKDTWNEEIYKSSKSSRNYCQTMMRNTQTHTKLMIKLSNV